MSKQWRLQRVGFLLLPGVLGVGGAIRNLVGIDSGSILMVGISEPAMRVSDPRTRTGDRDSPLSSQAG